MEDYKANKREIKIINRRGRPKMSYFGLQTRAYGEGGEEEEEEEEEEESYQAKVWIHDFCMDFGKILSKIYLGMDC